MGHVLRGLRGLGGAYDGLLRSHKLATSTASGAAAALLGDAFTQSATSAAAGGAHAAGGARAYDRRRGAAFTLFGGVVTGPVNGAWLGRLDRIVRWAAPMGGARAIATKVAIQAAVFQPVVYVPLFFGVSAAARGWDAAALRQRARDDFAAVVRSVWTFWTPVTVFTFAALPLRQQAVFFAGVGLVWNAVLSYVANAPIDQRALARCWSGSAGLKEHHSDEIETAGEIAGEVPTWSDPRSARDGSDFSSSRAASPRPPWGEADGMGARTDAGV